MLCLSGITLAVWGGDAREVTLVEHLAKAGAIVKTFGLPVQGPNIIPCREPDQCLAEAKALILPAPGVNEQMMLHSSYLEKPLKITEELLQTLPVGTLVLVGMARQSLRLLLEKQGLRLLELMQLDEIAILNSIPSAEGAVQMAMERMPITIHGSRVLVLGFGRVGQTLAALLTAMHAETMVCAKDSAQLARAATLGLKTVPLHELIDNLQDIDLIYNTIPAPVIDEQILLRLVSNPLIIDLASSPGGTDFDCAWELGIDAVLAPGLPGRVAPKTAGQILARVVPKVLLEMV